MAEFGDTWTEACEAIHDLKLTIPVMEEIKREARKHKRNFKPVRLPPSLSNLNI